MNRDPRGSIVQTGSIMRIDQALVEEASCLDDTKGYLLISYSAPEANNDVSIQTLRLNLNRNTVILDLSGQRVGICGLRQGAWISAIFSARMTRSIPPQANAFLILVTSAPQQPSSVTTGRIAYIDHGNQFVYTGNPNDINSQTRYVVSGDASITDRRGNPISIWELCPGQRVRITHANFQTASIPPQTTAFAIQVL